MTNEVTKTHFPGLQPACFTANWGKNYVNKGTIYTQTLRDMYKTLSMTQQGNNSRNRALHFGDNILGNMAVPVSFFLETLVSCMPDICWVAKESSFLSFWLSLPGGATIFCHFWKSVVLRQSLGLSAYALCRDISSCMGSRMTHSCKGKVWNINQGGAMTL